MKFELDTTDGRARRGRLVFDRGVVETPCFMPVGISFWVPAGSIDARLKQGEKIPTDRQ